MFGKSAYLSVEVSKLEGQIEILLKRRPTTHWGFCFTAEPVLQLNEPKLHLPWDWPWIGQENEPYYFGYYSAQVVSALENRSLPHLTSLVSSAIKRIIRKKHTKPNYTKRYGPLFPRPEPTLGKTELLLQSSPLSVGKLLVRVVSANRVAIINQDPLYCTVSIGEKAWDPHCCPLSQNISFDTQLNNIESTGMGIVFEQDKPEESTVEGLIIDNVGKNSPASKESLKPGDIVTAIENTRISNIGSALAASFTCSDSARLTIKRPSVQYKRTEQYSGDVSQDMAQYQEQLEIQQLERTAVEEDDEYLVVLGKFLECSTELIDPPPSRSRSGSTASTRDPPSSRDKDPTVEECRNSEERVMCTKLAPASITLHWDQYFSYNVEEHHKYISVCLWRECSDKPVLVGYANISLTDVVLQCVSTASNTHHESVILVPTPNVKWQESGPLQQPVPSLPPLLPKMKLIAGEVKLQFTHTPPDYDSALCQEHTFVLSQFQARMRCAQCMRTNVHHTAYICLVCSVTVHQNCLQHYTKMNTEPADPPQVTKSLRSRTFSQKKRRSFVARSQSAVFRQTISSTVEEPKLVNNDKITLPSFFFLKGTEKKMAVLKEKLAEVDHDIKMKFVQRKDLLVTKQQCHSDHTPVEVDQGISSCEEFIKNLLSQKAELQTRLKAQKERLPNSVPTSSEE